MIADTPLPESCSIRDRPHSAEDDGCRGAPHPQGQSEHRIQLTSLHATGSDEPYGGADGGLIGIHYQAQASGAVSHGCIRLSAEAVAAVDALPLGTPVRIVA